MDLKQGDPRSLLMFKMFINYIIDIIKIYIEDIFTVEEIQLFMLLYADDALFFFSMSSNTLQSMLNDIKTCCET